MPILLKDIPRAPLNPDEVEALSNNTFDYADKERVSIREARRQVQSDIMDKNMRANLAEINRVFGSSHETRDLSFSFGDLLEGPGEFNFKEKTFEVAKSVHRGLGSLVKLPGVGIKAIGENAPNRREIDNMKDSAYGIQRLRAKTLDSPVGRKARSVSDLLRRAGNRYTEFINGMMTEESPESRIERQGSFMSSPFYRTAMAVGESAPSYGLAVAATLTSGNPNIGLLVLGSTSAGSSYDSLREQGVDPDLALIGATLEGTIEMVTEKVPMDILMKGGGRPFLTRALRLGTAESFQELFAQLGQNYVEAVVKDVDPEDYSTVVEAARKEWSVIAHGWEDAMAAGFIMGGGASAFSPAQRFGRSEAEMRAQYGVVPRNTGELLYLMEQVRQEVKKVEKQPVAEPVVEEPVEPAPPVTGEGITAETKELSISQLTDIQSKAGQASKGESFTAAALENLKQGKHQTVKIGFDDNGNPFIVDGNARIQAAQELGLDTLPVEVQAPTPTKVEAKPEKTLLDNLTPEERTELETLEKQFSDKITTQLNIGLDPETFILATKIGGLYVKAGYRSFKAWAEQVRSRIGEVSDYTLRTVYAALREQFPDLDADAEIDIAIQEIGKGEVLPRGTSVSVMAQAIEDDIVAENAQLYDELPTYRVMNMAEQAQKALNLIESDLERAKRIAFYQEAAPLDLFPENVFSALRTYAKMTTDVDLIMDLALNIDAVREHTIMGKRIKSLDTDQELADPVRAIREIVEIRKEQFARKGKDISALESKLRDLQAELDRTKRAANEYTKHAKRVYGKKNTLVTRSEYDKIIARRKKEAAKLRHDPRLGAAYVPNAQDFTDLAKIGAFHLEAIGRDFAQWSYRMTRDLGEWVTPLLQDGYDRALLQAKKEGVEIKESKRLTSKKKRLATTTKKIEGKLEVLDLDKVPRIPIELDAEGQKLQDAYDLAREKYKAAQAIANIITEKEVRLIAQLAKDAAERKATMEQSERRKEGKSATDTELEYGVAITLFLEYVSDLKSEANKRTSREVIKNYLANPVDFISDFAGTLKAAKASLDNSFLLRQGLPAFLKAITGHVPSAKIWWDTFKKSWKIMWNTLRKRKALQMISAEILSDPDYDLLKKSKVSLNVIEEEIPVDIPSRIPLLGILFRMGENAFVGSARYMRYQLAKQYINVWRKSGKELNKIELESIGLLANSQTGRGEIASNAKKPGLLNNLFWSPRNLRAYVDILTIHAFNRNFSAFARKQAAINLVRYISGAAMILAIANWVDDDSVTSDSNSADFGKIKVGNTRFSVGGGLAVLVVLASRLITRKFTSSTTGKTSSLDTRRFGALGGKDLVFNFVDNKLSPAAQLITSLIEQKTWDGDKLVIPQMVDDALTPLIIQNVMETGSSDDSANVLAALIAEALGINVQTYSNRKSIVPKRKNL